MSEQPTVEFVTVRTDDLEWLQAEVERLEGINATMLHLLTQYGDKADEWERLERAQAAKIEALKAQARQEPPYQEYERLTAENERLRDRLAAHANAGKVVEGLDSNIPY
jgi:membrane carboxypeptidase/penicillin-binding protein PbpC